MMVVVCVPVCLDVSQCASVQLSSANCEHVRCQQVGTTWQNDEWNINGTVHRRAAEDPQQKTYQRMTMGI